MSRFQLIMTIFFCGLFECDGMSSSSQSPPPIYNITATSLFDAGLQQGRAAKSRIQGWLASDELTSLIDFTQSPAGRIAFERLKRDNAAVFPQYVDELRGIAKGAELPLDSIWVSTLISELESLTPNSKPVGHCSDIYATSRSNGSSSVRGGIFHGHNEDWPGEISSFFYFVKYTAAEGADFASCAGLVYPGSLLGFAPTWNAHGVYLTQNSLFPIHTTPGGLCSAFVQRDALCGVSHDSKSLDNILLRMTPEYAGNWSSGASVNLVDLKERRMANIEVHQGRHAIYQVVKNYSHFNMYKELEVGIVDNPEASSVHRQARIDILPIPYTRQDVIARLSDNADAEYPVFRNMTLTSMVLDGTNGNLDAWCCGQSPATNETHPAYSWNILKFFNNEVNLPL